MRREFDLEQQQAVQDLVGMTDLRAPARRRQVPIADIRRTLDLPPPPAEEWIADDCWLAGGAILRWLCGGLGRGADSDGDFDFFTPDLEAFNRHARRFLENGCTFRCFRTLRPTCQRCLRPGELLERVVVDGDTDHPLPRVRCPDCGEFGGHDAAELRFDQLPPIDEELVQNRLIFALELTSPEGRMIHLSARARAPNAAEMIGSPDFSIVQLLHDTDTLYFGAHTWGDLFQRRLRYILDEIPFPGASWIRLHKYRHLGFRPYAKTTTKIVWANVSWILRYQLGLGRLVGDRLPSLE